MTVVPVTIFTYRAQMGAADPTDIFLPILIATYCSTLVGCGHRFAVPEDPPATIRWCWATWAASTALIAGLVAYFSRLDQAAMEAQSPRCLANFLIFGVIIAFMAGGPRRRVNLYERFVDGAKDGFKVAVGIIPYLVAMLVAIGVFRASGALDLVLDGVRARSAQSAWTPPGSTACPRP